MNNLRNDILTLKDADDGEERADGSGKVLHGDVKQLQGQHELEAKIRQYESGEKGRLNSIFPGSLRHWLDHCYSLGELGFCSPCLLLRLCNYRLKNRTECITAVLQLRSRNFRKWLLNLRDL